VLLQLVRVLLLIILLLVIVIQASKNRHFESRLLKMKCSLLKT
jgi:hypothetical protein